MLTSRYFGGPQGLGLSADTLATAADRLRDQRWTLAQTAAWYRLMLIAPTGFVFNALDALNTQLIQPFRKLRAALASTAASLGLFNKAAEYRDIGLDGDRWWDAQLAPLLALARALKLGEVAVMPIPWAAPPNDRSKSATLRKRLIHLLVEYEDAYRQLAQAFATDSWASQKLTGIKAGIAELEAASALPGKITALVEQAANTMEQVAAVAPRVDAIAAQATTAIQTANTTAGNINQLTTTLDEILREQGTRTLSQIKVAVIGFAIIGGGALVYLAARRRAG